MWIWADFNGSGKVRKTFVFNTWSSSQVAIYQAETRNISISHYFVKRFEKNPTIHMCQLKCKSYPYLISYNLLKIFFLIFAKIENGAWRDFTERRPQNKTKQKITLKYFSQTSVKREQCNKMFLQTKRLVTRNTKGSLFAFQQERVVRREVSVLSRKRNRTFDNGTVPRNIHDMRSPG